jgi:hypothetical protein
LISQAQPLPKRFAPASANFSLNASKLPKVDLMSSPSFPEGSPPFVRAHDFPKEGMVRVSAAVVADDPRMSSGTAVQILDQIFDGFVRQLGFVLERVVDVGDVSLVMLGVVDFHRARVDVRLERVVGVREVLVIRKP